MHNIHRARHLQCAILSRVKKKNHRGNTGADKKIGLLFTEIYRQCVENFKAAEHRVPKPGRQRKLAIRVEMRRRNFDSRGVEDAIYERQNSPLNNVALRLYVSSRCCSTSGGCTVSRLLCPTNESNHSTGLWSVVKKCNIYFMLSVWLLSVVQRVSFPLRVEFNECFSGYGVC